MKIYLLNPVVEEGFAISRIGRCVTKVKSNYLYPPTELLYIASYLRERGHEVYVIDGALLCSFEDVARQIRDPDFFIIMVGIFSFSIDSKFIARLKERFPDGKIIVFGQGASFITEEYLNFADFVVFGEPEKPILEIVEGKQKVRAVSYKKGKKKIINKEPNFLANLDDLPFPARDLIDNSVYRHALMRPYAMVYSARGCPYQCIFCTSKGYSPRYRVRSVENVVAELKEIYYKYKLKNFGFMDETFTLSKERVIRICKEMIKNKLKMRWIALGRVDKVDKEMLTWMRRAGCKIIMYGIESCDQKVLDFLKKDYSVEDVWRAVKLTKKAGIETHGFFIFGSPADTKETIEKTIQCSKKLGLDYASFNIFVPYPGTESFKMLEKQNAILTRDWSKYDQAINALVFKHPKLTERQVQEYILRAYREFYFRPSFVLKRAARDLLRPNYLIRDFANVRGVLKTYFRS